MTDIIWVMALAKTNGAFPRERRTKNCLIAMQT